MYIVFTSYTESNQYKAKYSQAKHTFHLFYMQICLSDKAAFLKDVINQGPAELSNDDFTNKGVN